VDAEEEPGNTGPRGVGVRQEQRRAEPLLPRYLKGRPPSYKPRPRAATWTPPTGGYGPESSYPLG
jgi:hypothetical protein